MLTLPEQLVAIHAALDRAGIGHAFGGAIALAFWTNDPRGTSDIDVNVFVAAEECESALTALPAEIGHGDADVQQIKRDGQIRLWWDQTPVDLFFNNLPIHEGAAQHQREVPFEGTTIPVLGPIELALFKAMFDRTKDWADIEEMLSAQTLDVDALRAQIVAHVGANDTRLARLDDALERSRPER